MLWVQSCEDGHPARLRRAPSPVTLSPRRPRPSRRRREAVAVLAAAVLAASCAGTEEAPEAPPAPAAGAASGPVRSFEPIARFPEAEGSALVASRRHPGVYWALRDSGEGERNVLYALRVEGGRAADVVPGVAVKAFPVPGATNVDWEALGVDDDGHLWVGDVGNNDCGRAEQVLYRVREPDPARDAEAAVVAVVPFDWPPGVPGSCPRPNTEALFTADGVPYLVTKALRPAVYRLPEPRPGARAVLAKVGDLTPPPGGFAKTPTAADLCPARDRLVVATAAHQLWVYRAEGGPGAAGPAVARLVGRRPVHTARYRADGGDVQVEGVAFDAACDLVALSERREVLFLPARAYEAADAAAPALGAPDPPP